MLQAFFAFQVYANHLQAVLTTYDFNSKLSFQLYFIICEALIISLYRIFNIHTMENICLNEPCGYPV